MSAVAPSLAAGAVTVVIVTHNSGDTLAECLRRTVAAERVGEIVLVDNASTDGALKLAVIDPRIRLICNSDNRGFGAACNQGAAVARQQWLAFLNPDCFVDPDTFTRMLANASREPDYGLLGADVRDPNDRAEPAARRRDPNLRRVLSTVFQLVRAGDPHSLYAQQSGDPPITRVDAVSGALMLIERRLFEQLGRFDQAYRLHAEDLDLCRRVRSAGRAVGVAEDVRVIHVKGTSSTRHPLFVAWHKHRGLARYFMRYGAGSGRWATWMAVAGVWLMFGIKLPLIALRALRARA